MSAAVEYLSFSRLNTLEDCPAKYDLKYRQRVPQEEQGSFIGGKAIHRSIEESEREGWWSDRENFRDQGAALVFFHAELERALIDAGDGVRWAGRKSRAFPNGEDGMWWHREGESMLRRYQDVRSDDLSGIETVTPEMRVTMNLPSGTPVLGYIDAFLSSDENGPALLDWKTGRPGGSGPWQLATYAVLVEHSPAIAAVGGEVVDRGALVYLRAKDEGRVVWYDLAPLKALVVERYEQLLRRLASDDFPFNPSAWHESCGVRDSCTYYAALRASQGGTNGH